jgi:glycosyltransferase involved in cell wall biosynthesis
MTGQQTMRTYRILQVTLDLSLASTGVYTTAKNFYRALSGQGHDVTSVSFDRREYESSVRDFNVRSIRASGLPALSRLAFSWRAAAGAYDGLLFAQDALFLHSLYGYHINWAARRAKPSQCAFVIPHGALREMCFGYRRYRKLLWLRDARGFFAERATFIFSSEYERAEAMERVSPRHSEVLAWPVSSEMTVQPAPLPGGPRVLLSAGRLHSSKRTLETVRAFRRLARPGWQLHLAGLPSEEVSVADVCQAAGPAWESSVFYRGNLRAGALAEAYRGASGIVLFSHGENFANAIAEGVANGCAAFVSDRVGLASDVRDQGWGTVFEHRRMTDTGEELDAAMNYCERDTDDARRRRLLQSREIFSVERFSKRLLEITARGIHRATA